MRRAAGLNHIIEPGSGCIWATPGDLSWIPDASVHLIVTSPPYWNQEAERRLRAESAREFEEFLILGFKATNVGSFPFEWVNYNETRLDYAAALARISAIYQQRF